MYLTRINTMTQFERIRAYTGDVCLLSCRVEAHNEAVPK